MADKESKDCAKECAKESLPPLSASDFKIFNGMADHMELFHNHFRQTWNLLWGACEAKRRPQGMSLKQFINEGLRFVQQLTMHHGIEEAHIFPRLATRMPEFRVDLQHQHHEIHDGLVVFEEYLKRCRDGKCDFELAVLQEKMQPWEKVLWDHLDDEVRALGAENMRRYWTKEEMLRMPM